MCASNIIYGGSYTVTAIYLISSPYPPYLYDKQKYANPFKIPGILNKSSMSTLYTVTDKKHM